MDEEYNFFEWLLGQDQRGDYIGELAHYISNCATINTIADYDVEELKDYLYDSEQMEILDEAYVEWNM